MTWKETLDWQAKEEAFLNTIDLLPYLEKHKNISYIIEAIENDYGSEYTEEELLFNCMNTWDFIQYLKRRYSNFQYYECHEYRVARI